MILRQEKLNQDRISKGLEPISSSGCGAHASDEVMALSMELEFAIGATIEFEFELISVVMPENYEKEFWEMEPNEKYRQIPIIKDSAAANYKQKDYNLALDKYSKCISLCESLNSSGIALDLRKERADQKRGVHSKSIVPIENEIELDELETLEMQCRLNFAACKLNLGDYGPVIEQCTKVLQSDSNCVKALFRRMHAYIEIGRDLDLALADYDKLESLIAKNGTTNGNELMVLKRKLDLKFKKHKEKEKSMFSGKLFE